MSDNFKINTPKIGAITVTSAIGSLKHNPIRDEDYSVSQNNRTKLQKRANFTDWNFRIYRTNENDSVWSDLVEDLESLNTRLPKDCEIDTINFAGTIYSCFFDCYYNRESKNPSKFIECNLYRQYSNENEV